MSRRTGLSKSRISIYEQCLKRLWLSVHRPELAQVTASVSASFDVGNDVGVVACALYPEGRMISAEAGLSAAAAETASLINDGWDRPLFEATFVHDDVLVRVDLMLPVPGGWHVAEVKSTTGVKAYHLGDLATQLWVMRNRRVPVASAAIRHIDRSFVLKQAGEYEGLFADTAVDDLVEPLIARRSQLVGAARATLDGDEPAREIGAHCDDPFTCPFKGHCGRDLPPDPAWPASLLPDTAGKRIAREWQAQGIDDLLAIPADAMSTPKLARVHAATLSAQPYHDHTAIIGETCDWAWPRIFLDFETIQFAIPRWVGTRPYQQIPFQFSAHVAEQDSAVRHEAFLSTDGNDPRRACAEALAQLPATGAVVSWNASFERGCLLGLAALFADLAPALTSLADRLVDLLPVVRRHYYHRDMRGSWSIKAVLPTVAPDLGYDTLVEVKSGTDAQLGYLEALDPDTSPVRREAIRQALEAYCRRDTEAMMVVLERVCRATSVNDH